jgi:tRNA pseudouridine55 synthase
LKNEALHDAAAVKNSPIDPKSAGTDGFLLLNKNPGLSSFDSLSAIKKAFATRKVGHTGTLDKFASGLLLVLVGRGVKLAQLFMNCVKEYRATIFFGLETDTLDPEGTIVARQEAPSRGEVEAVLGQFRGKILQAPPAYSAIHINGRRAHELVREGKEPEMKKRPVTVFELELLSWTPPYAQIRTLVSSGTYIRSLARDIALSAGSCSHLCALERTRIGPFSLDDALDSPAEKTLYPLDKSLFDKLSLPVILIDRSLEKSFFHGRPLEDILPGENFLAVPVGTIAGVFTGNDLLSGEKLLGIIERQSSKWVYKHVFTSN